MESLPTGKAWSSFEAAGADADSGGIDLLDLRGADLLEHLVGVVVVDRMPCFMVSMGTVRDDRWRRCRRGGLRS